jgi:hypothetical protein
MTLVTIECTYRGLDIWWDCATVPENEVAAWLADWGRDTAYVHRVKEQI